MCKDKDQYKGISEKNKVIMFVVIAVLLFSSCAVRRPLFSPHRSNSAEHQQAQKKEQCLACHKDSMLHDPNRGDCLKCHRILLGE